METSKEIKDIKYNNKRKKHKFKKSSTPQWMDFVVKNVRYFVAGVIFVLMIVVAAFFLEQDVKQTSVQYSDNDTDEFEIDAYPQVMSLIENYYKAYAAGDFDILKSIATPFSEYELAYMELFSQYVEGYENLTFYTKPGLDSSSYLVNVYLEMKFEGVDTLAPGLDFFYVRTAEDGSLYIDNSYSEYNMKNNDNPLDINVHNLINEHEQQEDLMALLSETTEKFNEAVASDPNLYTMVNETIPAAASEWMAGIVNGTTPEVEEPVAESTETEEPETTVETETVASETPEQEPESEADVLSLPEGTVITLKSATNVRKEMSTESALVATLYQGQKVTVVMSYAEGWTKVKWDNKTGYIRTDLLQ